MVKRTGLLAIAATTVAAMAALTPVFARQNIVNNGSLELGPGESGPNPMIPANWTEFGNLQNVERSQEANRTVGGVAALKAFGESASSQIGAYQRINATPGDVITVSTWLYTRTGDKLGGTAEAGIRMGFYNAGGSPITPPGSTIEIYPLNSSSPVDTWIPATLTYTAPANTAQVQITCRLKWAGSISGAAFWDDLTVVGASGGAIINGDFETAGVSGEPNSYGIEEWFGFNDQEKSDEAAFDGDYSVKMLLGAGYSGIVQTMADAYSGDRILLIGRGMIPAATPLNGTGRGGLKLEFEAFNPVPPPVENLAFDVNAATNSWQLVALNDIVVPDEVDSARITMIYWAADSTTNSIYFDSAVATINGGGNVLYNDSFESGMGGDNGLDDWNEFGAHTHKTGTIARDGFYSAWAFGAETTGVWQELPVLPGQVLDVSAWLYADTAISAQAKAGVKIEWALGGELPMWIDMCDPGQNNCIDPDADPLGVWKTMTIDYTMPANSAAHVKFTAILEKGTANQGSIYFDGCEAILMNVVNGSDYDEDGDEDLADFAAFQTCFNAGVGELGWNCRVFDLHPATDGDGDVDLADYGLFQPNLTGPQ